MSVFWVCKTCAAIAVSLQSKRCLQVPLTQEQQESQEAKPERMALGGGGGFQIGAPKYKIEEERALVVLPELWSLPLPNAALPEQVFASIAGILVRL